MKHFLLLVLLLAMYFSSHAQSVITPARIHAHNDYHNRIPFYDAYRLGAGSIEADIVLQGDNLYVAHDVKEIQMDQTLDSMYLRPLQKLTYAKKKNSGRKKEDAERTLQLLIDIKTEGEPTLDKLVSKLSSYPAEAFVKNTSLQIVISGNTPDPSHWSKYPSFIHFDGRPNVTYTREQLDRIAMISDNFTSYSKWNGKGLIPQAERDKIEGVIASVHRQGKKIRFWATPDQVNAWKTLLTLAVDFIGTDHVDLLTDYVNKQPSREYTHTEKPHAPYTPKYVNNDKRSKVKNIILMIGDGMGIAQVYSGYTGNQGALNLFNMLNIGFSITGSADSYITDSAAGGTAMATGRKTNNRYVGVDSHGARHRSIPEIVKPLGIRSALISAGDITDATPAVFYAHQPERAWNEAIALDFLSSPVDILIGGGSDYFNKRSDNQNLLSRLQKAGYVVSNRFDALDTITHNKFILLDDKAVVSKENGRGDFLSLSLNKSILTLKQNKKGFFIMAEGAQIDDGGHANKMSFVVKEMIDFDKAIGEAMRFADTNGETLVIVTADHETGGLSLLDGDIDKGYVDGNFSTDDHSAVMVPVFAYGPHSQDFRGVYQNTAIFEKVMRIFELYNKEN
ncbi:MAG TPA: alkaline phosphatase [Chryseolinea sp.]|nr:alkaline phosphatase [Chryseolinea sp.]